MEMLKFLFSRSAGDLKIEPQRVVVTRALTDLNSILAGLDPKPKITLDPETGAISIDLPVQMPDEALALPAPDAEADAGAEKAA